MSYVDLGKTNRFRSAAEEIRYYSGKGGVVTAEQRAAIYAAYGETPPSSSFSVPGGGIVESVEDAIARVVALALAERGDVRETNIRSEWGKKYFLNGTNWSGYIVAGPPGTLAAFRAAGGKDPFAVSGTNPNTIVTIERVAKVAIDSGVGVVETANSTSWGQPAYRMWNSALNIPPGGKAVFDAMKAAATGGGNVPAKDETPPGDGNILIDNNDEPPAKPAKPFPTLLVLGAAAAGWVFLHK